MKIKNFKEVSLQGLFWLLPIVAIMIVIGWLYNKIDFLMSELFYFIGFVPQNNEFLWIMLVLVIFVSILYFIGHFMNTKLASFFDNLLAKIPGYSTIKDIISIFNSSKKGDTKILVVVIKGFAKEGYNIGLMYSQKESIIKNHYTVTLSQTPIPNGGYMFEVHKDNIFILEEATFDNNLQYLLSMGVKSLADILKTEPKDINELSSFGDWIENNKNKDG